MVLSVLALLTSLFVGYVSFRARAKYIYVEYRLSKTPGGLPDQAYEVEEYGCVSLLATVFGVVCCITALTSFVMLLYQITRLVIIPLMQIIIPAVPILYGIIFVSAYGFFMIVAVLSFLKDLFNPQR